MTKERNLLEELQKLQSYKKSKKFYSERLGVSLDELDELYKELRNEPQEAEEDFSDLSQRFNMDKGTAEFTSVTTSARSLEELIRDHKIDKLKYKVSSYWSKQKGDKFYHSLFLSLIKPSEFSPEHFAKFLLSYKSPHQQLPLNKTNKDVKESISAVISIADFHIDKATLEGDDIENRKVQYMNVLTELLTGLTSAYSLDSVVFVISNDYFHTDNYQNSTTNLTPQDVLVSYDKAYEEGFDLMVRAIDLVRTNSNYVEVILVQGNHDRTKSFYMAHGLELYFKHNPNITFDRKHSTTKYTTLGNTFIGFHHGNSVKIDDLPLLFATNEDSSADFGLSKYREVHTGDKHYYLAKEIKGVRVQQMPSLSGVDRWHNDNNYRNNIRAGLALIYHNTKGKIGELESRI